MTRKTECPSIKRQSVHPPPRPILQPPSSSRTSLKDARLSQSMNLHWYIVITCSGVSPGAEHAVCLEKTRVRTCLHCESVDKGALGFISACPTY